MPQADLFPQILSSGKRQYRVFLCSEESSGVREENEPEKETKASGKPEYTHFLSFPLKANSAFLESVDALKQEIISKYGLSPDLFTDSIKLHATIAMLSLKNSKNLELAKKALEECRAEIYDMAGTTTVLASVKGLDVMNQDAKKAKIVFLGIRLPESALKICKHIIRVLMGKGIISRDDALRQGLLDKDNMLNIKWHITLMNAKYLARKAEKNTEEQTNSTFKKSERNVSFDASKVVREKKNVDFGLVKLCSVDLCALSPVGNGNPYLVEYTVHLP